MTAPTQVRALKPGELEELQKLYDQTKDVRIRTRTQMILLAVEAQMTASKIGQIVRKNEQTVRRWLRRFNAEGCNGLSDAPRSGAPGTVTEAYSVRLVGIVRQRPRALDQAYSLWTLHRLADFMAEDTGIRVSLETVRRILKAHEIVLSRPQHTISSPDPEYKLKKRRLRTSATT